MKCSQIKGDRKYQEDGYFYGFYKAFKIIGIIDGHGGSSIVRFLEKHFIKLFKKFLVRNNITLEKKNIRETVRRFFIVLDEYFIKQKSISGCCLSIMFCNVIEKYLCIVQLGDTKILILNNNFQITYNTIIHRLDNPEELNRIMSIEGLKNINTINGIKRYKSLMITRTLGDYKHKNKNLQRIDDPLSCIPSIILIDYEKELYSLFITDGVYEILNLDDILTISYNNKSNFELLDKILLRKCIQKKVKKDNITIIVEKLN